MTVTPLAAHDRRPIERAIARQAAQWLASLYDEATPQALAACARWRAADPEHERAWQRAQRVNEKFGVVPTAVGLPVLGRKVRVERRQTVKALLLLMTAVPAGYVSFRYAPWREISADYRTAKGERREIRLADGTRVQLGTGSSIDVAFDGMQRLIRLRAGEILVTTGNDAGDEAAYRPFVVQTTHGRMRALGTRFVVRKDDGAATTLVSVLEHAVEVRPQGASERPVVVNAGQQLRFGDSRVHALEKADAHVADWSNGVLFASRMRLADLATELNRYRPGLLRCDPAVADLRISGAFQLANTDAILAALPDTLPVSVLYRTRYWVAIVAPPAARNG